MKARQFRNIALASVLALSLIATAGCNKTTDPKETNATTATTSAGNQNATSSAATSPTIHTNQNPMANPSADITPATGTVEVVHPAAAEENRVEITAAFSITTEEGAFSEKNGVYTITKGGEYTLTGKLSEGYILIDAPEDEKVTLTLAGASITSTVNSPICSLTKCDVKVRSEEGTFNEITDARAAKADDGTEEDEETGNAVIYVAGDLSLVGKGTLVVTGGYNNGVQSKKDLEVKNVTLKVTAYNHAFKGKNTITIESGELTLIACNGDGMKTVATDVSDKGKQHGVITIEGGNIDIYAYGDGIAASYDAVISGEDKLNLNIYTAKYSAYSGVGSVNGTTFYLVMTSGNYSADYDYYAYFYNDDYENGAWAKATYTTNINGGGWSVYYGLTLTKPSGYSNVAYFRFNSGVEPSLTNYDAVSESGAINTSMNGFYFDTVADGVITGDYVSLRSNSNGSSNKATQSAKGIKAGNNIAISGGTITIYSEDDGIHTNAETFEDGTVGAGTINIDDGMITITAADDGIHADKKLVINNGAIVVLESYEGLEAVTIVINNGNVVVNASDDGVNACTGTNRSVTPSIEVNGGYLEVTTPSGDTDGLDSNGNILQTGGVILVKGGSTMGSVAGSVDVDGKITVTGGTIFAMGGICELPTNSVNAYSASGTSLTAGTYELTDSIGNLILTFTLTQTYSSFWVASEYLVTGETYTLTRGEASVKSWTQEAGTMGNAASSGGCGGPGGR